MTAYPPLTPSCPATTSLCPHHPYIQGHHCHMATHCPYGRLLICPPFDVYPFVHVLADSHVQLRTLPHSQLLLFSSHC